MNNRIRFASARLTALRPGLAWFAAVAALLGCGGSPEPAGFAKTSARPTVNSKSSNVDAIPDATSMDPAKGREFLKSKLAALDSFKSDPKFHSFGFGRGGPFNEWKASIEAARDVEWADVLQAAAAGDLELLGLEYMKTKGRENDYTRFAREQIMQVIDSAPNSTSAEVGGR